MGIKTVPPFHSHPDTQRQAHLVKVIFFGGLCKDLAQPHQKSLTICLCIAFLVKYLPVGNGNNVDSW